MAREKNIEIIESPSFIANIVNFDVTTLPGYVITNLNEAKTIKNLALKSFPSVIA